MTDAAPMFEFTSPYLDEPLRFNSVQELQKWARSEIDAWRPIRDLANIVDRNWINQISNIAFSSIATIETECIDLASKGTTESNALLSAIKIIENGKYVPANSGVGMCALDIVTDNPHAALMVITEHIPITPGGHYNNTHWVAAYTAATAAVKAELDVKDLNKAKKKQLRAFNALRGKWDAQFSDDQREFEGKLAQMTRQQNEWNDFRTKAKKEMAELVQAHWNEMARIKNEYEEELRLRSASSYWKTKEEQHAFAARLWLGVFGGTAFTLLIALFGLAPIYLRSLPHNAAGDIGISGLAAVTLPALMILWVMRHLSRLFVTHFHQREDARQRRVLITTYLALHNKSAASDAERLLILQALFRPNATKDDDDSAASALFDNLAKAIPK